MREDDFTVFDVRSQDMEPPPRVWIPSEPGPMLYLPFVEGIAVAEHGDQFVLTIAATSGEHRYIVHRDVLHRDLPAIEAARAKPSPKGEGVDYDGGEFVIDVEAHERYFAGAGAAR
jgi:hypothetical protein